jgi:metal-sulfur cluster biosynthetic enzyme
MKSTTKLRHAILDELSKVIDPETGVDVIRMNLIDDLSVDENGKVSYKFRPSSPLCPIAVPIANSIQFAIAKVPGVSSQEVEVVDFIFSDKLMELLKRTLADLQEEAKNHA